VWAAAQALSRPQPRVLVARYGVRDKLKLKPFSSLLLFSQPRTSDVIPLIEDPVGSFIDVEQTRILRVGPRRKERRLRKRTLYLFLAENVPEMLAIRSDVPGPIGQALEAVTLADVGATMAQWLGLKGSSQSGRPIPQLGA